MAKILIVEDDYDLALVLKRNLESNGFKTLIAYDAMQATRTAHQEKPDLIFLDLNLPAGGGVGILNNLKMSVNTNTIPIIVLTGTADDTLIQKALQHGVETIMRKPYELNELITQVKKILKIDDKKSEPSSTPSR